VLGALEVLQETALLVREVARDCDVDEHAVVAAAASLQYRHAPAAQHADLARLRARLELELGVAVERVDGHGGAEGRLRHGEVDGGDDVVAVAHEARVGAHVDLDVDVARPPAEGARVALAREADSLAVVDPRRDVDLQLTLLGHPPGARAVRARRLDHPAGAPAARAALRPDELAEHGARDRLQPPKPLAGRAGRRRRAGGGARPGARGAADGDGEGHAAANAARRLDELHLDLGEHVSAARGAPARPAAEAAEEVVAEEGREEVGEVPEVELGGPEPTGSEALVAVTVVELSCLRLREHLVGLRRLAKVLLRLGMVGDVGVELPRQTAEGGLDRLPVRVPGDAEDLVVVASRGGHGFSVLRWLVPLQAMHACFCPATTLCSRRSSGAALPEETLAGASQSS
jgi:hypothetical protein